MKRKIVLAIALAIALVSILVVGATAEYTSTATTRGGTSGSTTLRYTLSKYDVTVPNHMATNVKFKEEMLNSALKMDSFKITGGVTLQGSTVKKTTTTQNIGSCVCTVGIAYKATIYSATGNFYAYSTEFGNAYREISCKEDVL